MGRVGHQQYLVAGAGMRNFDTTVRRAMWSVRPAGCTTRSTTGSWLTSWPVSPIETTTAVMVGAPAASNCCTARPEL